MNSPMKRALQGSFFLIVASLILILSGSSASAKSLEDRIGQHFFLPEQLLQHSREIGLTDEQRRTISQAIGKTEGAVTELQWQLRDASDDLIEAVTADSLDSAAVTAKAERVLHLENAVKLQHLELLVLIKNTLSDTQKTQLRELR